MAKKIQILVACGSGIATSTLAVDCIENICEEIGINYQITKCTIMNIEIMAPNFDVIFTTNNYREELSCPIMNVIGFITGINEAKTKKEVKDLLMKISEEQ